MRRFKTGRVSSPLHLFPDGSFEGPGTGFCSDQRERTRLRRAHEEPPRPYAIDPLTRGPQKKRNLDEHLGPEAVEESGLSQGPRVPWRSLFFYLAASQLGSNINNTSCTRSWAGKLDGKKKRP